MCRKNAIKSGDSGEGLLAITVNLTVLQLFLCLEMSLGWGDHLNLERL